MKKTPGERLLLDTNILIDYFNGERRAQELMEGRPCLTSRVVWMELLVGVSGSDEESTVREFLNSLVIEEISAAIAEEAVALRIARRLRLPDAILLGTARVCGCPLVTRNTKDFKASWPEVFVPYRL